MKALQITNLKKTYQSGLQALKGIDLEVDEGDFFALLGPNGAGKSTTIGIITSLVNKTAGKVNIFGLDIDSHSLEAKSLIGVAPQEINFSQFENPLEILLNQGGYYGINRKTAYERAEKYLRNMGLWEKRNHPSRTLSGGLKRRLMIARALIHEPRLLILDEPTAGVDVELRRSMWDFLIDINNQGTTIVLTTHYLEEAENLCKNVAIIDKGNIIENTTIKTLLSKLDIETFIFDLKEPQSKTPEIDGFDCRMLDLSTLQADISKQQGLNNLFKQLSDQNIEILSMRNKSNRLEELFISLLESNSPKMKT
ncbi:MAG: ABC transporter ATP-binding protein [Gammaproteobacteria bacterium]|nr:ABC transporter ATP-binding protein [Gammaproteobacteria bacterium]MCK5669635.1 ABC transporter ATP-binding protein [Gammaproteobacteria bacterium]